MINDFGAELVNLQTDIVRDPAVFDFAVDPLRPGLEVGPYFDTIIDTLAPAASPNGLIFYLPPGRYNLGSTPETFRDRYELPANVQLYFCQGALLRPAACVDLVIRGSLHAGNHQIFGYIRRESGVPAGRLTTPAGRVIFATEQVRAVRPEWWGAVSSVSYSEISLAAAPDIDSWDSLQAAINAGSVDRDYPIKGLPPHRPALPVLLGSGYVTTRTLEVTCPADTESLSLILRGIVGPAGDGGGAFTIFRLRADDQAGSLLQVGPRVDFDVQDCSFLVDGSVLPTVEECVDVRCDRTEQRPRRGLFRRCTFGGGAYSSVRVLETEIDSNVPLAQLGLGLARHIRFESCMLLPVSTNTMSLRGVGVRTGQGVMLHLDGLFAQQTGPEPFFPGAPVDFGLPDNAVLHLEGGSMLVRGASFCMTAGPRPSRGDATDIRTLRLGDPDGQDVFLSARQQPDGRSGSHFTAIHTETQSWWFLSRPQAGDDMVVLMYLLHESAGWANAGSVKRYRNLGGNAPVPAFPSLGLSPTVIWLGAAIEQERREGCCVLLGCRMHRSILVDSAAPRTLVDVGTAFLSPNDHPGARGDPMVAADGEEQCFRPVSDPAGIMRPPHYQPQALGENAALDSLVHHLVPRSS